MRLSERIAKGIVYTAPVPTQLQTLTAATDRILHKWPDMVIETPEHDREKLVLEVNRRVNNDDWRDTKMSLVCSAARALFDEERRDRDSLSKLREFYYEEIEVSTSQAFLNAMLSVYLGSFQPNAPHTKALARGLGVAKPHLGASGQKLLEAVADCLNPSSAHESIARLMLDMDDCWKGLKQLGIRTPHAPGIMDYAHEVFVELISSALTTKPPIEKIFKWLKPEKTVRIAGADLAINAILRQWVKKDPAPELVTFITENLVGLYGDPRVTRGGVWSGVPQDLLDGVLLRWLTGENIRFFIDVVSAVEESHMWEPRRKFWLGLHERKRIDAAWVAFSDDAARYAYQQLSSRGNRSLLRFGYQVAQGNRTSTSLLILKIGNKVVIEGSHNYKVHIFRADQPNVPQLYQDRYDCERIRLIPGSVAKIHDVHGSWQGWVLERI